MAPKARTVTLFVTIKSDKFTDEQVANHFWNLCGKHRCALKLVGITLAAEEGFSLVHEDELADTRVPDGQTMTDAQVLDELENFYRTPEWSGSMLEDIAVLVRQARPELNESEDYEPDDDRAWRRH